VKKAKKRNADEVVKEKMISTQEQVLAEVKRIADAQEELLRIKKVKYMHLGFL